jgi:peptide/nickel transport system permease protein
VTATVVESTWANPAAVARPARGGAVPAVAGAARWLLRTLALTVPVFLFATFLTFLLGAVSGLSPAGLLLGDAATPADVARVRAELGLDRPVLVQYVDWLSHVVRGDFGSSWLNGVSVSSQIGDRLSVSLSVAGFALLIAVVAGTALGVGAAVWRGTWFDRAVTVFCSVVAALPPFVVAVALIVVFSVLLPLVPSAGYVPFDQDPGMWLTLITLPAVALSLDAVADIARQLRTGLAGAYRENYVLGAVVRGLGPRRILFNHVLRNGAGPALSVLGLRIPMLVGGAVVTESIFGMSGFGRFAADGALRGDVPVVQGTLVVAIVLVLVANTIVDALLLRLRPAARRRS